MTNKLFIVHLFIVFELLFISKLSFPQYDEIKFEQIRIEGEIQLNNAICILQDNLGFLWLGTRSGLVKYDGYEMKVYKPNFEDTTSISGIFISALCEDHRGNLWVGTNMMGLNRFDYNTETFLHYKYNERDTTTLNSNVVHTIYEDTANRLWIGTDTGLNLLNYKENNFIHYSLQGKTYNMGYDIDSIKSYTGEIYAIIEDQTTRNLLIGSDVPGLWLFDIKQKNFSKYNLVDMHNALANSTVNIFHKGKDGFIWIGTNRGLGKLDLELKKFELYQINITSEFSFANEFISLAEDNSGLIWVGTAEKGIAQFDPVSKIFKTFRYDRFNTYGLNGFWVRSLYIDNSGILWIVLDSTGLQKLDNKKRKFEHFYHNPQDPNSLSEGWVQGICIDQNGSLWVGTEGLELNRYNKQTNQFIKYQYTPNHKLNLSEDWISCIVENPSEQGVLWIGTWEDGLSKFDTEEGTFKHYIPDPSNPDALSYRSIIGIVIDYQGIMWIATYGGGLNRFDKLTGKFNRFNIDKNNPNNQSFNKIIYIYKDSADELWVTTEDGILASFDPKTEEFKTFDLLSNSKGPTWLYCIYEDHQGNFWIGTNNNGIYLFDRTEGIIKKHFTKEDGLSSDYVSNILEDDSGNLWIASKPGITKFNPVYESFKTFGVSDGLQELGFNPRSAFKGPSGEMYFGGEDGINYFHPNSIRDDPIPPKVVIENISLFNRPGEKLTFEKYVAELDELNLSYDHNDLRFEYVGLHFSEPKENKYKYILEGFDEDWIDAGKQRNATYTNLDPGDYIFRVNAANRDGIWHEVGASIKIIISPPLWATIWAYIIYAIIILSIIYFTWQLQLKRVRIKHDYEISRFEAKKMHEVDELKSRFFANISHEFRTPLTLIFGPAKDIAEETKEAKTKQNALIIKRNTSRLYRLVNQLLELSKLEAGKMKLQVSEQNIMPLLKGLVLSFASLADRKNITLNFNTIEKNLRVYIDKEKIEKVINNLLSNAFNFTPEGGRIDVTVEKLIKEAEIRIADNGVGIPKERINKIFDRFYQVDGARTRESEGTGIGLALTKELIGLHKGKIKVESNEGEGTIFTVLLPLGKEHLKADEIVEKESQEETTETIEETELTTETENRKEKTDIDALLETEKPLLLIVEDNSDVRSYIISHLEDDYRIQEAIDGEDGLNQAIKHIPDLIISDVMMPKMDGFGLCNKLKTDERTSHIPIIMLTAKATSKDKIDGYQTGADDYIMKPFDAIELKVRIKNLIEIRRKLQEKFSSDDYIIPKDLGSIDKEFMNKVIRVINDHLSEENFSIEELSKESAMSKEQIYKKLKALTGKSPSLFLRSIRLVKAKTLIKKQTGTISEISYQVGFNSPAYFTKCFNEEFGFSPSELLK